MITTKLTNQTPRQATLSQMNLGISKKAAQSAQIISNKKSSTLNRSNQPNSKPQIHEIINLQIEDFNDNFASSYIAQGKKEEDFVSELAKKCGAFFNWINQVDYKIFAEQLWKNKMMALIGERFPELNAEQQQKLIDRDWKIMAPEKKEQIARNIQIELEYDQVNRMINEDFERQRNQICMQFNSRQFQATQ